MSFEIRPDVRQVHLSDIAFSNRNYRDVQSFLYVVSCPVIGMRIKASRAKVVSVLTHEELRQAVLLDDKALEEADKSKDDDEGLMTEGIRSRIHFTRCAFPRLQSCLRSRCEISLRADDRTYHAIVRSI